VAKTPKILIIDDEVNLCRAISQALEMKDYSTQVAFDGEDGFQLLSNDTFDVVVSDIQMPKCTGVELLERIKALNGKLPLIILISGFSDYTEEDLLAKGANLYFQKPFSAIALMKAIENGLDKTD
jgi:DNA-binding response OmpR family regulator